MWAFIVITLGSYCQILLFLLGPFPNSTTFMILGKTQTNKILTEVKIENDDKI